MCRVQPLARVRVVRSSGYERTLFFNIFTLCIHAKFKINRQHSAYFYARDPPSAAHTAPVTYVLSGPNKKEITLAIS